MKLFIFRFFSLSAGRVLTIITFISLLAGGLLSLFTRMKVSDVITVVCILFLFLLIPVSVGLNKYSFLREKEK